MVVVFIMILVGACGEGHPTHWQVMAHDLRWVRWTPFSRWGHVVVLPGMDVSVTARGQWAVQCDWSALICRGNWTAVDGCSLCFWLHRGVRRALWDTNRLDRGRGCHRRSCRKGQGQTFIYTSSKCFLFPTPSSIVCCPRINYPLLHCNWDTETIRKPLPKPGPLGPRRCLTAISGRPGILARSHGCPSALCLVMFTLTPPPETCFHPAKDGVFLAYTINHSAA